MKQTLLSLLIHIGSFRYVLYRLYLFEVLMRVFLRFRINDIIPYAFIASHWETFIIYMAFSLSFATKAFEMNILSPIGSLFEHEWFKLSASRFYNRSHIRIIYFVLIIWLFKMFIIQNLLVILRIHSFFEIVLIKLLSFDKKLTLGVNLLDIIIFNLQSLCFYSLLITTPSDSLFNEKLIPEYLIFLYSFLAI